MYTKKKSDMVLDKCFALCSVTFNQVQSRSVPVFLDALGDL